MKTSSNGIRFLQSEEGFSAHVYNDNGKDAIGYGHDLLPGESFPQGLTQQQATDLLVVKDLPSREENVSRLAPWANQNQFDALVSFDYNLGENHLETMLAHGRDQIPTQILRWHYKKNPVTGDQEESQPLLLRRQAELALFNSVV